MTLGMLSQNVNDTEGKTCPQPQYFVSLLLGLCFMGSPIGVFAGDEPQELRKPTHMTVAPIFQGWQFDKSEVSHLPDGFSQEVGDQSGEGGWVVNKDATAPSQPKTVEPQLTCGEGLCYQLLVVDDMTVEYVDLSVRMKMRLGTPSAKAGLAYSVQDAQNFYAVVVEPKANEIVAYVVKDGVPKELGRETIIPEPSEWHFLRIQRNTIVSKEFTEISFDHHMLLAVYDQSFNIGKIGLVAMGDGGFSFDNLHAIELMANRPSRGQLLIRL